jgi:hypothetical protein
VESKWLCFSLWVGQTGLRLACGDTLRRPSPRGLVELNTRCKGSRIAKRLESLGCASEVKLTVKLLILGAMCCMFQSAAADAASWQFCGWKGKSECVNEVCSEGRVPQSGFTTQAQFEQARRITAVQTDETPEGSCPYQKQPIVQFAPSRAVGTRTDTRTAGSFCIIIHFLSISYANDWAEQPRPCARRALSSRTRSNPLVTLRWKKGSALAESATERAQSLASELEVWARRRPLSAIAGAMLAGIIIGMMSVAAPSR